MEKNNPYTPVEENINKQIDNMLNENPSEMKIVSENLEFVNSIQGSNVKQGEHTVEVWGVETFDLHDILKDKVWDRSIFVTDAIVNMCIQTSIEQMKKYLPKKTKKGFEYWWLLILMGIGAVAVILLIVYLLPNLGNIKLF